MHSTQVVAGAVVCLLAGGCGSSGSTTAPVATVPDAPTGVTAASGVRSLNVRWTAPTSSGGSAILGYVVALTPTAPAATVVVTGTAALVSGLADAATYTVTIAAWNSVGTGPSSTPSPPATTPGRASAPTSVVATADSQVVSVTWTGPSQTGGRPIIGYTVVPSPAAVGAQTSVSGTTATVKGLAKRTVYVLTVSAITDVGIGAPSTPSSGVALRGMVTPRLDHTATLLPDGRVLVAGGTTDASTPDRLVSAELFDPVSGAFVATGDLAVGRAFHTATPLPNGKVLIAGGMHALLDFPPLKVAVPEVFDPLTGRFTVSGPQYSDQWLGATATLAQDGRVVFVGGWDGASNLMTATSYDAALAQFTTVADQNTYRNGHTATLLATGKILIAGGVAYTNLKSIGLFDPNSMQFTLTAGQELLALDPSATLLPDGRVLFAGGGDIVGVRSVAQLYDPGTGQLSPTGSLVAARSTHTATLLKNGQVLIVGGMTGSAVLSSAELYDPTTGIFVPTGSMGTPRYGHRATRLNDGRVLVMGGSSLTAGLDSAEIYDPATGVFSPQ